MLKPSLLITLVIALLTASIWYLLSDAKVEPPWPQRIQGFSFSPVQAGQDPTRGIYPTVEQIKQDLHLLADKTYAVRTYTVDATFAEIPRRITSYNVCYTKLLRTDSAALNRQLLTGSETTAR